MRLRDLLGGYPRIVTIRPESPIEKPQCALSSQKWVICLTQVAKIEVFPLAQLLKSQ